MGRNVVDFGWGERQISDHQHIQGPVHIDPSMGQVLTWAIVEELVGQSSVYVFGTLYKSRKQAQKAADKYLNDRDDHGKVLREYDAKLTVVPLKLSIAYEPDDDGTWCVNFSGCVTRDEIRKLQAEQYSEEAEEEASE